MSYFETKLEEVKMNFGAVRELEFATLSVDDIQFLIDAAEELVTKRDLNANLSRELLSLKEILSSKK